MGKGEGDGCEVFHIPADRSEIDSGAPKTGIDKIVHDRDRDDDGQGIKVLLREIVSGQQE